MSLLACSNKKENKDSTSIVSALFKITNYSSHKIITVFNKNNLNDTTYSYVLYKRGTEKPSVNFKAMFVQTPVNKVACLSSLYVGCMEELGLLDKIIAVDNKKYICNTYVKNKIAIGQIKEISKSIELDIEQTILINPDLILTFGTGNIESDISKKIIEAGIPVAVCLDHLETSSLNRASWLKFIAAFFEKDSLADVAVTKIKNEYAKLCTLAKQAKLKPKVFTEIKYSESWFVPGGKSFMSELLNDAGADYIWKDNDKTGSLALSYEEVCLKAAQADYWINLSAWNSLNDCIKQDARNKIFKAYKNGNLYNNNAIINADGGNAYWETGIIHPNIILADLIKIFHPELMPQKELTYYKKLN